MRLIEGSRNMEIEEVEEILEKAEYCIISTVGPDELPYGFPMSYIYRNGRLYFHCGKVGRKIVNFKHNPRVSVTIVGDTKLYPEDLDTGYQSVIGTGIVREVLGDEKLEVLLALVTKYAEGFLKVGREEAERDLDITGIYEIELKNISGKVRRL